MNLRRLFTRDHALLQPQHDANVRTRFYLTEKVGQNRYKTPERFLVIQAVPLCRTGEMQYAAQELPMIQPGNDGLITITRSEKEVFNPVHVASYNGKPLVNDHPPSDVLPENWKTYACGVILNPRRGEGELSDCVVADVMVTDATAIDDVEGGKVEVSCGYDADYLETGVGAGEQVNLIGNHVALVDSGRCGSRCAIGDQEHPKGAIMKTRDKKPSWRTRLADGLAALAVAMASKDDEALKAAKKTIDEAAEEAEGTDDNGMEIHLHTGPSGTQVTTGDEPNPMAAEPGAEPGAEAAMTDSDIRERFAQHDAMMGEHRAMIDGLCGHTGYQHQDANEVAELEEALGDEAPSEEMRDAARKARDSGLLVESYQHAAAMAEILVPGITLPTFDRAAAPAKSLDAICRLRRTALDLANATPKGRAAIEEMNAGKPIKSFTDMSCKQVKHLFSGAAALVKAKNAAATTDGSNRISHQDAIAVQGSGGGLGPVGGMTMSKLQEKLNAHYGQKKS